HTGPFEEVAFTITNTDENHSESEPSNPLSQPKIVISTLVFNDFMFIKPWIAHYRKYGVAHFLIYFNHHSVPATLHELAEKNTDITVIPWNVPYAHLDSKIGKSNFHVAQPMQLHHSVILSKKKALGTHMLYIDVDEYIIGPTPLNELVNMDTDEIGFTNVWASSESDVDLISSQTLVDPKVDFTREHRKKSLRSLQLPGKWNIHGNAGQESIVTKHVMLHFGDIMKFESGSNFVGRGTGYKEHLQPISSLSDQHPLRDIFESQL
ncbi:glycosyltransferase family 2 protein, partial [Flavobacteriales bacterium]|nr:glycosyltransferase family 2 protein [Flavobacteriales bacterium]